LEQPPPVLTHEEVPLQAAGMGKRSLAFLLDCLLMGALCLFLLDKILLPMEHPGSIDKMRTAYLSYQEAVNAALESDEPIPKASDYLENEPIIAAIQYSLYVLMTVYFCYFLACELAMGGSTLGKHMFHLKTVNISGVGPPGLLQASLRALLKTFFLWGALPFTWIAFMMGFFTQAHRAGHDILARTLVVESGQDTPPAAP